MTYSVIVLISALITYPLGWVVLFYAVKAWNPDCTVIKAYAWFSWVGLIISSVCQILDKAVRAGVL